MAKKTVINVTYDDQVKGRFTINSDGTIVTQGFKAVSIGKWISFLLLATRIRAYLERDEVALMNIRREEE